MYMGESECRFLLILGHKRRNRYRSPPFIFFLQNRGLWRKGRGGGAQIFFTNSVREAVRSRHREVCRSDLPFTLQALRQEFGVYSEFSTGVGHIVESHRSRVSHHPGLAGGNFLHAGSRFYVPERRQPRVLKGRSDTNFAVTLSPESINLVMRESDVDLHASLGVQRG